MSISIESETDLSYSVHVCARCGGPMERVPGRRGRATWRCTACGRREH